MTFAEYNTDDNFDNKNGFESSLDELVKIGVNEGKTEEEIRTSLSPKWKTSSKLGQLSSYYQKHSANKKPVEKKKEEVKETVKETIPTQTVTDKVIKQQSDTANKQNTNMMTQQDIERQTALKNREENWNNIIDSAKKLGSASKVVNDHYIENLPRGIIQAYKNDEFGKAGSPEAKQRLGYFVVEAMSSPLKALANGFSRFAGQGDRFADTESQAEKLQKTNLQNALENRWNKYKQETNNAMDLLKQRGFADEAIQESIDTISANNRLQTAYNRATDEQKAYVLEVMSEVGDKIGNMNDSDFVDTIMGFAAMGESLDYKEAAGMLLYRFIKDPEKRDAALKDLGFDTSNSVIAGIGGSLLGGLGDGGNNSGEGSDIVDTGATGNKLKNPMGNLKGYKALDGNTYDFDTFEDKQGKETLVKLINDLDQRFYNGEINAETYRKYREPLYNEVKKHTGVNASTADEALKKNVQNKLKDLNSETKSGFVTVDDYRKRTALVLEMARDAGLSDKEIDKLKKDFINESKIKYKGPKTK